MAKKASKKIDGDVIRITFEETNDTLEADLNNLPGDIVQRLAMHGLSQKLGDSYAGVDAAEAFEKAKAVLDELQKGEWSTRVAAAGPRTTQLAEALASVTGKTVEEAAGIVENMDDDQKKDLRKHPHIKAALADIRAQAAKEAAEKARKETGGEAVPPLNI